MQPTYQRPAPPIDHAYKLGDLSIPNEFQRQPAGIQEPLWPPHEMSGRGSANGHSEVPLAHVGIDESTCMMIEACWANTASDYWQTTQEPRVLTQ